MGLFAAGAGQMTAPQGRYCMCWALSRWSASRGRNSSSFMSKGRQKPASQNGRAAAITGSVALATGTSQA